jgi:hypothetical protein
MSGRRQAATAEKVVRPSVHTTNPAYWFPSSGAGEKFKEVFCFGSIGHASKNVPFSCGRSQNLVAILCLCPPCQTPGTDLCGKLAYEDGGSGAGDVSAVIASSRASSLPRGLVICAICRSRISANLWERACSRRQCSCLQKYVRMPGRLREQARLPQESPMLGDAGGQRFRG